MFNPRCSYFNESCQYDLTKNVNIPIELYESMKGRYFIGYADEMTLS